jgi:hypothetical protein
VFANGEEERMYQLPLAGNSFQLDNQAVYRKLKAFLIDSPGWAWIEPHDSAENGRAAFAAWTGHYNGEGELSKRIALAKMKVESVFYRNERSLNFERATNIMTKCFNTLYKDEEERYTERRKVERLIASIRCEDAELIAAKVVIGQQYPRDFVAACGYFSKEVARVYGAAQLEYKQTKTKKRGVYAIDSRGGQGGRGRRRFGIRGNRGGRGRFGHGNRAPNNHTINGVDVSDPNRTFTPQEWEALGPNGGRAEVARMRERARNRGGRDARGRAQAQGRGFGGGRNVNAATTGVNEETDDSNNQDPNQSLNERGGRNGRGFGRGAYPRTGRG